MENGPPTIEYEDGTVDVERLLVEPQDEHVSVDNVMCFNEKISEKAIDIREVSHGFGASTGTAHEAGDILNRSVLESLHTEDDSGYFRLQNDFCSMGEEYLLGNCCIGYTGVGFAESIGDLEYVTSECLQNSVTDGPVLTCAGIDSPWKADLFRMEGPECQNDVVDLKSAEFSEIPSPRHEFENLAEKKLPKSPENVDKVHDNSSHSFDDVPSDENTTSLFHPKEEKNDEHGQTGEIFESNGVQGKDALATLLSGESQSDALPTLKRSRKPTKRYIDEVVDPILRPSKKRREVSSSIVRDKSAGVKDPKRCPMGSKVVRLPDEESAVKAIQVPFASIVHKECPENPEYNMVRSSDRRYLMNKPKDNCVSSENHKKRDECTTLVVHQMNRSDDIPSTSQKDDIVSGAHLIKRDRYTTNFHLSKRNDRVTAAGHKKKHKGGSRAPLKKSDDRRLTALSQKTREQRSFEESPKKKDEFAITIYQRERDNSPTVESPEEASGRRKHHRLWTIAEVKKLIDGVAEYGVGRWSRIKKIYFPASAHRTSVDLKDKWRNLLKASGLQGQHNEHGEKKRNVAWRPLPKSMLRRVCELAAMHPYPKGGSGKTQILHHVSPDRSTDITLSDYRRILRSINGT